jgi:hypothetical protein
MTDEEKIILAKHWYNKGVCPGCKAPLEKVAGQSKRHWKPDQLVARNGGQVKTYLGELHTGSGSEYEDSRLCPYTADDLAALVHTALRSENLVP